jgi:hypothetical protein
MKKTLTFLLLLFPLFSFAESIDYKKEAALLEVPESQLKCYLQEIKNNSPEKENIERLKDLKLLPSFMPLLNGIALTMKDSNKDELIELNNLLKNEKNIINIVIALSKYDEEGDKAFLNLSKCKV